MKIFITGAQGFVGKNLVEWFLRNGYDVLFPGFEELDLTCADSVQAYLEAHQVDVIVHSATTLRNGTDYPQDVCENNLRMFFNLVRKMKPSTKLINFGSGSEYSRQYWHKKMPETFFDTHVPEDPHSFSKYVISKYIENNTHQNMVTLRIFGIFGKHEDYRYKFISNAICKNLLHLDIVINQNVNYDYIYVDDFCDVVKYFVENDVAHRSYNVTPTASIDLITIASLINEISDFKSPIHVLNDGVGVDYSGDNARVLSECSGLEFMTYKNSISDLYAHYKTNVSSLNKAALVDDDYLNYAKNLRAEYFSKKTNS